MQSIDLTDYVVRPIPGTWSTIPDFFTPDRLTLVEATDGVTLAGPLRVRVSVQARNSFNVIGTQNSFSANGIQNSFNAIGTSFLSVQTREVFSYVLDIPPGQTWTYLGLPFVLRDTSVLTASTTGLSSSAGSLVSRADAAALAAPPGFAGSDIEQQVVNAIARRLLPGVNDRFIIVIRPAGPDACTDPCAPVVDPCKPPKHDCHCGCKPCHCHTPGDDLSCDFAVGNTPDIGVFFPAACEPCTPGASIGMPAVKGPSLIIPPARGGTARTRYFNGMFMTSEDLETDQRNVRLKRALMNRALGQGVVWGLNVGLDGEGICVGPGYGVDCCGNDIVITTPYRVDAQALLRDPAVAAAFVARNAASSGFSTHAAAASTNVSKAFALVLEYFECPEQPRPVHGDPCAPDTTRCETSRIRETARLRLAPPCPIDDSGPIKEFLAEVETLKKDPVVGPILTQTPKPQASAIPDQVPFGVSIKPFDANGNVLDQVRVLPKAGPNPQDRVRNDVGLPQDEDRFRIEISTRAGSTWANVGQITCTKIRTLLNGTVVPANVDMPLTLIANELSFTDSFHSELLALGPAAPGAEPIPAGNTYLFKDWRVRDTNGTELTAPVTEIQVTPLRPGDWFETPWADDPASNIPPNSSRVLHLQVLASDMRAATAPPPIPCFNECGSTTPRFPVTLPWLHEDPTRPGKAADPRVLALALVYSLLAIETARNKVGSSQAVNSARLQVTTAIYNATWKLFFGTVPDTDRFRLTDGLQRLLRAWCCALLYPGPTCHCEPHGVVIGCASVSSGRIQSVDPWGGRRWVVHYPLLSYWGQLFGITPLDAIASKIFGLICCIAGLPVPDSGLGTNTGGTGTTIFSALGGGSVPSTGRGSEINFGRALLVISPPAEADARIAALGFRPDRVVSVSPVDFVSRFADALRVDGDPTAVRRALVHFTVLGLPEFHLVALGDPEPGTVTPARDSGRLRDLVQAMLARRTGNKAVPPLLRTFTEDLSRDVISAVSIEGADPAQKTVAARLGDSGITTLGALLGRAPEDLHSEVLRGEQAEGLAALIDQAEADATAVSKAVADAVIAAAAESKVFARAEFRKPERAIDLGKRLGDKLTALDLKVGASLPDLVARTAGGQ